MVKGPGSHDVVAADDDRGPAGKRHGRGAAGQCQAAAGRPAADRRGPRRWSGVTLWLRHDPGDPHRRLPSSNALARGNTQQFPRPSRAAARPRMTATDVRGHLVHTLLGLWALALAAGVARPQAPRPAARLVEAIDALVA